MLIYVTAIDSDQTLSPSCLISVKGDAPFQEVMKESESIIESVYEDEGLDQRQLAGLSFRTRLPSGVLIIESLYEDERVG